jgi:hypothetical protein
MRYLLSAAFIALFFSGCVVKEDDHYHHRHHDRVYVEEHPHVEGKVVIE